MTKFENYKFCLSLQIRWGDLDPLGHINNAVYVTYFEIGRSMYMPAASSKWDWYRHMFLIGEITVRYHRELKIGDPQPEVWVRTAEIGTKSFVLEYAITTTDARGNKTLHATGNSTQIMYDMKTKSTIPVAGWLREDLQKYESTSV